MDAREQPYDPPYDPNRQGGQGGQGQAGGSRTDELQRVSYPQSRACDSRSQDYMPPDCTLKTAQAGSNRCAAQANTRS